MSTRIPPTVALKPGREKSLLRRHPWVFSGAIGQLSKEPVSGESVCVRTAQGGFLGWGTYSPESQIRVRMWSFSEAETITAEMIRQRVESAILQRKLLQRSADDNSLRLIHSEADLLPGVIADQYDTTVVVQILTAGAEVWREVILQVIRDVTGCACLFERSEADVRALEGLPEREEIVFGQPTGAEVTVCEHGIHYRVQLLGGQKTGFYLDQRDNRLLVRNFAANKRILDCFCFQGGFTLNALSAGAESVTCIDSSEDALRAVRQNLVLNRFGEEKTRLIQANAFEYLRKLNAVGEKFDLIVLDPPKLAATQTKVERALRAYKDLNMSACRLLNSGGVLFTFSCSGGVTPELFQKVVAGAALDAGRDLQFIHTMRQSADHPVLSTFPESEYLKGLVAVAI